MKNLTASDVRSAIEYKLTSHFGVTGANASPAQVFDACAMYIRELMSGKKAVEPVEPEKQVHYLSMEFLLGRSLAKNAYNLGVLPQLTEALSQMGKDAADIFEEEPDAGLGNGGLGRLAACYMDSAATLNIPCTGYSLCYELGIFRQKIVDGKQMEVADNWLPVGKDWLVNQRDDCVTVRFGGRLEEKWDYSGKCHVEYSDFTPVVAVPRDMLISGFGNDRVNTLRLWEATSPDVLDMSLFSEGKYVQALEQRTMAEVITKVLYPADEHIEGKLLRLKQQYFFVSATAQDIVRKHRAAFGSVHDFARHHVLQINDTHPTMVIPELMRIFMDEDGLGWDEAWSIVSQCVAYTNHTVMSEALESWPAELIQQLLPRIWQIICEIDRRRGEQLRKAFGGDRGKVEHSLIVSGGKVHMANLCLAACYKINGVSRLHGDILKHDLFADACSLTPERFTYVTNGIDHRRWLAQCDPRLHELITQVLGSDAYLTRPEELCRLNDHRRDDGVLSWLMDIKRRNKEDFAAYMAKTGVILDPGTVFDVQVKRLHEYKRQLMCAMMIAELQNRLRDDPNQDFRPRTFIFGAKAASGYYMAKRIISLICALSEDIARDPACRGRLSVVFLENYRVSIAERLMPAAQVSEQISTAGKEASGTGNMKLMANGAVTIGTLDGANVEMYERLGGENMFLFGLHADEAARLKRSGYRPRSLYDSDWRIRRVLDRFKNGLADGRRFDDIVGDLLNRDEYLVLADFGAYLDCCDRLYGSMADEKGFAAKSLTNIAESGIFAADRAVGEYARDIWHI